ncbi:MAG TPA: AAA family ATPase [Nocardioidaceae bacterium]|nr:AAA family ATPase [Nocardioidaceae bacterium]
MVETAGAQPEHGRPGAMRGRDDLLDRADRRLTSAVAGAGQVLLVTGESGIGKSRLLHGVQQRAAEAGCGVWSAAAFPQDLELSGGLLLDLGHALARAEPDDVASHGRSLLSKLDGASHVEADGGDAHRRRRLLVLDVVDTLARLVERGPALMALEDLHWCDELSLEVVGQLARRLPTLPMLVVATIRTDELSSTVPVRAWRSRLLVQRRAEEVRLERLDQAGTEQVVRDRLPGQEVSRALVELVHHRSAGVPLYVEELVDAAAQGRLAGDPAYVPETLAEAIQQRLATLSPAAQAAAVAAAALRHAFDVDLLAAVGDISAEDAAHAVDELVERQVVQEESPRWFTFRHALIRDAVEVSAPLALRRALHARIADVAHERQELGGAGYRSAHHEAAGQLREASLAAEEAALQAVALSAHREALELLHRAIRCLPGSDVERRVRLLTRRAAEAAATDHNQRASEDYEAARGTLLERGDVAAAAALLPGLVAARHLLGDPLASRIALIERGLAEVAELADEGVRRRTTAALWAAQAAAYLVDDRLDDAVVTGEQALGLAGDDDERTRLNTAATVGSALVFAGRGGDGWTRLEQATLRARELGLEAEAARGYRMLGSSASALVEYDRAEHWLGEGVEYAERTEQWNHRHYMSAHLAHVAWCRGRLTAADEAAQRILATDEGGITTRITGLHVAGFVALALGRVEAAAEHLREARAAGDEMGELQRYSPALWGLAECAVLTGDHAAAVELTDAGWVASRAVADGANLFPYLVTGTRARLAAQDPDAARAWVVQVGAALRSRGIPGTMPAVDHAEGLLWLASGRTGRARERLSSARTTWSARSRWWEAHWCALDLARCAIASNRRTDAAVLVAEVRGAAAAVAAQPLLEAASSVAGRLDRHDAPQPWSPLTLRELEVARLVARGLTNREIADELHITARTAGSHLEHIRAKLGASRRSEIAAWVTSVDVG